MHSGKTNPKHRKTTSGDASKPSTVWSSAVWSIKAHHLGWVARVSHLCMGWCQQANSGAIWRFSKTELIYQTFFAVVLEHPKNCVAMPSGHLCATRGLPSRHLSKTKLQNTNSLWSRHMFIHVWQPPCPVLLHAPGVQAVHIEKSIQPF